MESTDRKVSFYIVLIINFPIWFVHKLQNYSKCPLISQGDFVLALAAYFNG